MEPQEITGHRCADSTRPDLEQALESLEIDARLDIRRLLNSYQDRVRNIDEYIIHPGLKDLASGTNLHRLDAGKGAEA